MGCSTGAGCVNCLQKFRAGAMNRRKTEWGPRVGARREEVPRVHVSATGKESHTHTDMGKLDPERAIAGGKVLVLLPRLQVRQHPSDWPQNHKHAHMVTFRNAKEQPGTHSHSHKQMHACWATHKCHGCTLRLWVEFTWCHLPFRSLSLVRWQNHADACLQVSDQLTDSRQQPSLMLLSSRDLAWVVGSRWGFFQMYMGDGRVHQLIAGLGALLKGTLAALCGPGTSPASSTPSNFCPPLGLEP